MKGPSPRANVDEEDLASAPVPPSLTEQREKARMLQPRDGSHRCLNPVAAHKGRGTPRRAGRARAQACGDRASTSPEGTRKPGRGSGNCTRRGPCHPAGTRNWKPTGSLVGGCHGITGEARGSSRRGGAGAPGAVGPRPKPLRKHPPSVGLPSSAGWIYDKDTRRASLAPELRPASGPARCSCGGGFRRGPPSSRGTYSPRAASRTVSPLRRSWPGRTR